MLFEKKRFFLRRSLRWHPMCPTARLWRLLKKHSIDLMYENDAGLSKQNSSKKWPSNDKMTTKLKRGKNDENDVDNSRWADGDTPTSSARRKLEMGEFASFYDSGDQFHKSTQLKKTTEGGTHIIRGKQTQVEKRTMREMMWPDLFKKHKSDPKRAQIQNNKNRKGGRPHAS